MDGYLVGKITNTHGIRGEVRVTDLSDFARFTPGSDVFVIKDGKRIDLTIVQARPHKNQRIVLFEGYGNINDVLFMKGMDLYATGRRDDELEDDDYRYEDLVGKKAVTTDGEALGTVTGLLEVPQGHILEIVTPEGKALVPFVKAFVGEITDETVTIHPIEGLL